MYAYKVGDKLTTLRNLQDGARFDMTDEGALMTILLNKPTQEEIKDIKGGKLQFGMFVKNNVIFILSKFGGMQWMDSPYHVALSPNLNTLGEIEEGQGYGCNIVLADSSTGEIKVLRLIGFSTQFSRKLKSNIELQKKQDLNRVDYDVEIATIMMNYSVPQMVKFSEINCRIR